MVGDTVRTTCFREQLTQVCVGGGGRGRRACGRTGDCASLQSLLSLRHHTAPAPPASVIHGDPCQEPEHGRTDGRRIYAAALADRRALDCTRRRRCCAVICNKYISSQVAAGPFRLCLHAAGYSATATCPVRTSRKCTTYSDSLDRAASRSLTPL